MHLEILSKEQVALLPILSSFKKEYYLVGGTATALHIGHRESLDFDLFKEKNIRKKDLYSKLNTIDYKVFFAEYNQVNMMSSGVKITFFSFPYKIPTSCILENHLKMTDWLTLGCNERFSMGRKNHVERLGEYVFYSKRPFFHQRS